MLKKKKINKKQEAWYKPFILPGLVAVILAVVVLVLVKNEIDRFTLIMPIFAGYILYMILTTPDEEEEETEDKKS